jgi:Conserved protein/domain typically associated with flavoprotein oxygenases, DIM6/NTAB family
MDTAVFRDMSYGVYIVSTLDGERPTGCIANSIMQITSSPATIAVSINHDNYTNGCIAKTGKFAFSILAERSDTGLIGNFGFRSGKDEDKFRSVDYETVQGIPVVKGTCGYVVCRVVDKMETATHTVFLGEVLDGGVYEGMGDAMTYAYYHKVVKGKSPKNAPTYLPEKSEKADLAAGEKPQNDGGQEKYVCQVCGYAHEGALPEGFKCPVCGVGTDRFKKAE